MYKLLKYKIEYKLHAFLARNFIHVYLAAPNDVIGEYFYRLHKDSVFKAHTARKQFEELTNGEN